VLFSGGQHLIVDQLKVEHVVGHEGSLLGGDAADDLAVGDRLQVGPVALDRLLVGARTRESMARC
jgi:hypothetical protein